MGKKAAPQRLAENEAMSVVRNLRTSPRKLNLVAQTIRGKNAASALAILAFSKRRIANDVRKAVQSAIANAENIADGWDPEDLRNRISELEQKVGSTNNKKTRRSGQAKIDAYQSFLDSTHKLDQTMLYVKEAQP